MACIFRNMVCTLGVVGFVSSATVSAQADDVLDVAEEAGRFGIMIEAVRAAGLEERLRRADTLTVFAPTDEAFLSTWPKGFLAELIGEPDSVDALRRLDGKAGPSSAALRRENRELLRAVLSYHIVDRRLLPASQIRTANGVDVGTLHGAPVRIDGRRHGMIEDAKLLGLEMQASNGVVHAIDRILMPDGIEQALQRRFMAWKSRVAEIEWYHGVVLSDKCLDGAHTKPIKKYKGNIKDVNKQDLISYSRTAVRLVFKPKFRPINPDIAASALKWRKRSFCSGTLISKNKILTAAHCFPKMKKKSSAGGGELAIDEIARLVDVEFEHPPKAPGGGFIAIGKKIRYDISRVLDIARPTRRVCVTGVTPRSQIEKCVVFEYALLEVEIRSADFDGEPPAPRAISCTTPTDWKQAIIIQYPRGVRSYSYGPIDKLVSNKVFAHGVSTDQASSGAGLLDRRGRLIGIHTWGGCAKMYLPYDGRNFGIWVKEIADRSRFIRCAAEN